LVKKIFSTLTALAVFRRPWWSLARAAVKLSLFQGTTEVLRNLDIQKYCQESLQKYETTA